MFLWNSVVVGVVAVLLVVVDCSLSLLDKQNFTQTVVYSEKVWVVEFYSPHCSLCREFEPDWYTLVNSEDGGLEFGQVNIDDEDGFLLADEMGVFEEGLPNIKVFPYEYDSTGVLVWNGVEQPAVSELKFKLQGILGEFVDEGGYRKLPHLMI
eukprot:TRINITY_DN4293_c1_g1_i1.p3 TRINITY_DN4293_c1_g1~~TRINITY_DN4293_c1_g1_i1.p3  ORF type:complete len:153 (-),score=22.27 TRINITY_DN4293_c1_g1_i1:316-774(-)